MNLEDDVKRVSLSFLTEIVQKGLLPTLQKLEVYLDLEFVGDWKLLYSSVDLEIWFNDIINQEYMSFDELLEEILIHNNQNFILIDSSKTRKYKVKLLQRELDLSLEILCLKEKVDWNELNPFVSFKSTLNGKLTRVSLIHKCLSCEHSHKASIRFHSQKVHRLESFFDNKNDIHFMKDLYKTKKNILICGSTGSGKTSFISSLISDSKNEDHIIIIEDTKEISSPSNSTTRLLSRNQNGHSLSDYCNYALRMRPDRIILGEVRSKEVTPLILNANNGHKGLLCSLHSNSARSAPQRLSTLLCLYSGIKGMNKDVALDLICSGIEYIIFLEKKKVTQAIKILNYENGAIHFDDILESKNELDLEFHSLVS